MPTPSTTLLIRDDAAMTWVVHAVGSGTLVEFIAENVPVGVSAEDLVAGMASSLENLDRYLET